MKQKKMFIKRLLLSLLFMAGTVIGATAQDMAATPLTFEAAEVGTINIVNPNGLTIAYSKDGTTWTSASSDPISIAVAAGDQVRFRGDNAAYGQFDMMTGESYTRFTATNDVYVYGNVMSLISSTDFPTLTTLERVGGSDEYAMDINLAFLFSAPVEGSSWEVKNNTTIKNHPTKDIVLPATNATRSGYMYMFAGCQGLTRAPELPATELSLGCYHRMFDSCTSLEKAPVLAAATVPEGGYSYMFAGCSSLNYVKCLATDISAIDCTGGWLTGVAAEGIFIKAEGMNDWTVGPQGKWNEVNGIPAGWAVSSETPLTLEAVEAGTINIVNPKGLTIEWSKDGATWTAASSMPISISVAAGDHVQLRGDNACYGPDASGAPTHITATNDVYVYGNIMSLVHKDDYATDNTLTDDFAFGELFFTETANTTIKSHPTKELLLPTTSLPMGAYMYMFANCQGLERAPELPAMTMSPTCYHRMFGDCTSLTAAPKLPATTLADECYFSMFDGCTALTTAPELPATTLAGGCYSEMFARCTSLTKAPVLLATTLANNCYEGMFDGCSKLSYVKCLATDLGAKFDDFYTSTHRWLDGVSPTGTFVKAVGMEGWLMDTANGIPAGWTVKDGTDFDPVKTPLTIEAFADATTVTINNPLGLFISYDQYDAAGNLLISASSSGTTINIDGVDAGGYVQLGGYNTAYSSDGTADNSTGISVDKDYYLYGNIMSLIDGDAYATLTTLTGNYAFARLFRNDSHLKNHPTKELVLPATTLSPNCYRYTFQNCTSMTTAPELPATVMAEACYFATFIGCTSLTVAPELPSTQLAPGCYTGMFANSGLVTPPVLPATELAERCYYQMFYGCSSLATAPELPALTVPRSGYNQMFYNCSSLTEVPQLPATTIYGFSYNMMFRGCTGLTSSPALPVTTMIDEDGMQGMFYDCSNLVTAGDLSATTVGTLSCNYMFHGCTKLTKAPALPATKLDVQCYQRMFDECHSLVTAPELPATELADLCYNDMFWNCTSLKNAPELPATTLVPYCYTMMFFGCSSLEKAPDLPATKLEGNCYEHMFMNCTSLSYVKCLATDLGDETSTDGWLTNVASTGTFVQAAGADWSGKGTTEGTDFDDPSLPMTFVHGIPEGWTVKNAYTVTMPTSGIATFSATEAVGIPDELTAYTCPAFDSSTSTISLQPIDGAVIPAETGVLLRGDAGASITLESTSTDATPVATNLLVAVTTPTHVPATTGDMTNFMLSQGRFIRIEEADDDVKMPANKAYLQLPTASIVSGARTIGIAWDETATAIDNVERSAPNTQHVYDLQGRSVVPSAPGLYIINGKKVYIK